MWDDLDIFQAATDQHRIISALQTIYGGRWLSTGGSKGGMATIYHRRFYERDIDGSVAYVAPSDVLDRLAQQEQAIATLRRWAGVDDEPAALRRAAAVGTGLDPEPSRDPRRR